MIDLRNAIDEFAKACLISIPEYEWGGSLWRAIGKAAGGNLDQMFCEDFTKKLFQIFHQKLEDAVNEKNEDRIIETIQLIIGDWGGINMDADSETIQKYVEWLLEYGTSLPDSDNDLLPHHWSRIASWSKILAALKPGEFYIYDSRVAVALQLLLGKTKKVELPTPRTKGAQNIVSIIRSKVKSKDKLSYTEYCRMLRESNDGNHIEKQLFMLGGWLNKCSEVEQEKIAARYLC